MKKKILLSVVFLLIIAQCNLSSQIHVNLESYQDSNSNKDLNGSGDANQIAIAEIRVDHQRGDSYANMEMDFMITDGSSSSTAGMFSLTFLTISKSATNVGFDIRDGTLYTSFGTESYGIQCISQSRGHYSGSMGCIIPYPVSMTYKGAYVTYRGDIYYWSDTTGTSYSFTDTDISYSGVIHQSLTYGWHLEPTIKIDSNYYNLQNLVFDFYTCISDTIGGYTDLLVFDWIRMNPEDSVLTFPFYKIRISDYSGNVLYEDANLVLFQVYRTISIDSVKIENNSPDPIHVIVSNGVTDYIDTIIPSYSCYLDTLTTMLYDYEVKDILDNPLDSGTLNFPTETMISYTPEYVREGFISLANQDGIGLDFTNYQVKIDSVNQYSPNFYRVVDESITIDIYDRFDTLLNSYSYTMDLFNNFISIPITQYKLKIFNNQLTDTSIRIIDNPETNEISDNLASNNVETYMLSDALYTIEFYDEFSTFSTIDVDLNVDTIIRLPTTSRDLIISLFDESFFGVSMDNVRLYYDNVRTTGFVETFDGTHNIKVLDFFNSTLFEMNVDITPFTEFNVYLPIYTLILQNQSNETMELVIEREGIPFAVIDQQIAGDGTGYQFRFAKDLDYIVSWIYLNGTLARQTSVRLDSNVMIESFGYSSKAEYLQITDQVSPYEWVLMALIAGGVIYGFARSTMKKTEIRQTPTFKTNNPSESKSGKFDIPKSRNTRKR